MFDILSVDAVIIDAESPVLQFNAIDIDQNKTYSVVLLDDAQRVTIYEGSLFENINAISISSEVKTLILNRLHYYKNRELQIEFSDNAETPTIKIKNVLFSTSPENSKPIIHATTFTYRDANSQVTDVTGSNQILVQSLSDIEITVPTVEFRNGAGSGMVTFIFGGQSVSEPYGSTITIPKVKNYGDILAILEVSDTRGYSDSITITIPVTKYSGPVIGEYLVERNLSHSESTHARINGSYSSILNGSTDKNSIQKIEYRYCDKSAIAFNNSDTEAFRTFTNEIISLLSPITSTFWYGGWVDEKGVLKFIFQLPSKEDYPDFPFELSKPIDIDLRYWYTNKTGVSIDADSLRQLIESFDPNYIITHQIQPVEYYISQMREKATNLFQFYIYPKYGTFVEIEEFNSATGSFSYSTDNFIEVSINLTYMIEFRVTDKFGSVDHTNILLRDAKPVLSIYDKKVGIGTGEPKSELDVNGIIFQNGTGVLGFVRAISNLEDANNIINSGIYILPGPPSSPYTQHFPAGFAGILEVISLLDNHFVSQTYSTKGHLYKRYAEWSDEDEGLVWDGWKDL